MSQFDFVASTGRTATTFIATTLNSLPGVLACHEGYIGNDKASEPALPLINLENAQGFLDPASGTKIVMAKRSQEQINAAAILAGAARVIDVAYYNSVFSSSLLQFHPQARMVGIIRNCAQFVRSCTTLSGEDPLPVGWPDSQKKLTDREVFIAMGRIRPGKNSPDRSQWADWSAIRKNIWLWEQTNQIICATKAEYPDRVMLARFETLADTPEIFWESVSNFLNLPKINLGDIDATTQGSTNRKPFNYQVGVPETWSESERAALQMCQSRIERSAHYDC